METVFKNCICVFIAIAIYTLSPLALLMALKGRSTLNTLRIFTTEIALDLDDTSTGTLYYFFLCVVFMCYDNALLFNQFNYYNK